MARELGTIWNSLPHLQAISINIGVTSSVWSRQATILRQFILFAHKGHQVTERTVNVNRNSVGVRLRLVRWRIRWRRTATMHDKKHDSGENEERDNKKLPMTDPDCSAL
jgi:hypothetical protein